MRIKAIRAIRGDMPDTATYAYRSWLWLPTAGFGGDGLLTITQRPVKGGGAETDLYGVEEIGPEFPACRSFLFVNLTDDDQEQPYRATVGAVQRCTCDAGHKGFRRTSCKHRDGANGMIAAGVLPIRELQGA